MKIAAENVYEGASPEQLYAVMVDPDFQAEASTNMHALSSDVDVTGDDTSGHTVRVTRELPAQVPDFVKKFVGETITVVQEQRWGAPGANGRRTADVVITIQGQPGKMTGVVTLSGDESSAREVLDGDLTVSVPLVGKKIEPEVAKAINLAWKSQAKSARQRLGIDQGA